jgi:hypothetical protein
MKDLHRLERMDDQQNWAGCVDTGNYMSMNPVETSRIEQAWFEREVGCLRGSFTGTSLQRGSYTDANQQGADQQHSDTNVEREIESPMAPTGHISSFLSNGASAASGLLAAAKTRVGFSTA